MTNRHEGHSEKGTTTVAEVDYAIDQLTNNESSSDQELVDLLINGADLDQKNASALAKSRNQFQATMEYSSALDLFESITGLGIEIDMDVRPDNESATEFHRRMVRETRVVEAKEAEMVADIKKVKAQGVKVMKALAVIKEAREAVKVVYDKTQFGAEFQGMCFVDSFRDDIRDIGYGLGELVDKVENSRGVKEALAKMVDGAIFNRKSYEDSGE